MRKPFSLSNRRQASPLSLELLEDRQVLSTLDLLAPISLLPALPTETVTVQTAPSTSLSSSTNLLQDTTSAVSQLVNGVQNTLDGALSLLTPQPTPSTPSTSGSSTPASSSLLTVDVALLGVSLSIDLGSTTPSNPTGGSTTPPNSTPPGEVSVVLPILGVIVDLGGATQGNPGSTGSGSGSTAPGPQSFPPATTASGGTTSQTSNPGNPANVPTSVGTVSEAAILALAQAPPAVTGPTAAPETLPPAAPSGVGGPTDSTIVEPSRPVVIQPGMIGEDDNVPPPTEQEHLIPEQSGLAIEAAPFDVAAMEKALQQFLDQATELRDNVGSWIGNGTAWPWLLLSTTALMAVAHEILRRRLQNQAAQISTELGSLEALNWYKGFPDLPEE